MTIFIHQIAATSSSLVTLKKMSILTDIKTSHITTCIYWLQQHSHQSFPPFYGTLHLPLKQEASSSMLIELVSGGIFNQSGSVFYRITSENSLLEIQLEKAATWLPVCYERWNSSVGTLVCRQLGYLRLVRSADRQPSAPHTDRELDIPYICTNQRVLLQVLTYSSILSLTWPQLIMACLKKC